jgi:hypothetical protein
MDLQQRLLKFVTYSNWIMLGIASLATILFAPMDYFWGIFLGGLIVTINFHLLYRTIRRTFAMPTPHSHNTVLFKYYVRFIISGILIFLLLISKVAHPIGLIVGLSLVVASIMLATLIEVKKMLCKEAA